MNILPLIDKDIQEQLEMLFFDIKEELLNDEEIVTSLINILKESNQNDKEKTIQHIKITFEKRSFLKLFLDQIKGAQNLIDYKVAYKEALKNQSSQTLLELIKQQQFWEENSSLKRFSQNLGLISNLQDRIIEFFELIENSENNAYCSQYELLKILLGFIYNKPNKLSIDENNTLQQICGSLLIKQIYELQTYVQFVRSQNQAYFETFINLLQKQQICVIQEQNIDKNYQILFELFSQDLTQQKESLDQYISLSFGLQSQFNFEEIMKKLDESLIIKNNFYALYFRVITFFWIQYCQQFNLIPQLKKTQEQCKSKSETQIKQTIFQNFQKKLKTNDQIQTYILQNFVYQTTQSQQSFCQETFKQFQTIQKNNLEQLQKIKTSILDFFSLSFEKFNYSWLIIKQIQFQIIEEIKINWKLTPELLLFLWKNKVNLNNFEAAKKTFNKQRIDLLDYAIQLENNQDQQGIIIDLLTITTKQNNLDINILQLLKNIYFKLKTFKIVDKIILEKIRKCHELYQQKLMEQFEENCFQIYQQNELIFRIWLEPLNYFSTYQIRPHVYERKKYFNEYPRNTNISLEEFNISLVQQTEEEQKSLAQNWIQQMNSSIRFKDLLPSLFNIIKRGEASKPLTQSIYNSLQKQGKEKKVLNMKALFQIFFNNSDQELKAMLVKLYSQSNPVPLIYQNYDISSLKNELGKIGKTELINKIFYKEQIFAIQDDCQINANTIDLMMDFSFSGTRNFSIADAHGIIPMLVLEKVLSIFNCWIIQMDQECEIEENFDAVQDLRKRFQIQKVIVCFIVRNSTNKGQESCLQIIDKVKANQIQIHFIRNLVSQDLNNQCQEQELDNVSRFILNLIEPHYQSNLVGKEEFYRMQSTFDSNSLIVRSITESNQIMTKLSTELDGLSNEKDGFFSQKAFQIRHLKFTIKGKKQEIENLYKSNAGNLQKQQQNNISQQITQLEDSFNRTSLTKLLDLFNQILKQKDYYILLIQLTEILQKFNKKINFTLYRENTEINDEIAKLKKQRESFRLKNDDGYKNNGQFKNQMDTLMEKLVKNLKEQTLKNIGIELFWREIIKLSQLSYQKISINIVDIVYELIKKGEPFEFLDGDNLTINHLFLQQLAQKFKQDGEKRILTFSVLGPQSSGKSTILNRIFGCHFLTSVGRCTKGIYLQLIKVQNENHSMVQLIMYYYQIQKDYKIQIVQTQNLIKKQLS